MTNIEYSCVFRNNPDTSGSHSLLQGTKFINLVHPISCIDTKSPCLKVSLRSLSNQVCSPKA